jgi:hypothetical protein
MAEGMMKLDHPYEKVVFVTALCQDDSVNTTELLRRMNNAGLGYLVNDIGGVQTMAKKDLCDHIIGGLQFEAEKYEFLFYDCRDAAISKRHILNTLAMMDLTSILANIDVNKASKGDICDIINKYLQVLMEAKGLTLAQGPQFYGSPPSSPSRSSASNQNFNMATMASPNASFMGSPRRPNMGAGSQLLGSPNPGVSPISPRGSPNNIL